MFKKFNVTKFIQSEGYFVLFIILNFFSWFLSGYFDKFLIKGEFHIGFIFSIVVLLLHLGILLFLSLKEKETYFLIPGIFGVLFAKNTHINVDNIPYFQVLICVLTLIPCLVFVLKNKVKIQLKSLGLGFLFLTLCGIISLINAPRGLDLPIYFMAFNWVAYILFYLVIVNTNRSNLFDYLTKAMIYLGLFVSLQIIYIGIRDNHFVTLKPVHFLGWGISNEAATLIFCCIPFLFYKMTLPKAKIGLLFIFLFIFGLGEFLTMSRAGYVLFIGIGGISFILTWIYTENKKTLGIYTGTILAFVMILSLVNLSSIIEIFETTFADGFGLTGREDLYKMALEKFMEHPIIGTSLITSINDEGRFVIYHSTFFNTLATTGLLGMASLIFHLFQKYRLLSRNLNVFVKFSLVYFILSDIYGLFDNTYNAFQYTIVMVIALGLIEASCEALKSKPEDQIDLNTKVA